MEKASFDAAGVLLGQPIKDLSVPSEAFVLQFSLFDLEPPKAHPALVVDERRR